MKRQVLSLAGALLASYALAACGRSQLDVPEDVPDTGVVVDVPLDRPDSPDFPDRPDVPMPQCTTDAQCDDGLACNGAETCQGGSCQRGPTAICNDGVVCTVDQCVEGRGCVFEPDNNRCVAPAFCDPMRDCTPVECTGPEGCDNGDPCDGVEVCAAGRCVRGSPLSCDDGVACTVDQCVPGRGCVTTPDDSVCNDRSFCNGAEQCLPGRGCAPGMPVLCDDRDPCTADACDEARRGCITRPTDGDGDGFGPLACAGGRDCNDNDRAVNPGTAELCLDGRDNNCDGRTDCADVTCAGTPACGMCMPTGPENCTDGLDNDCDRLADCADRDCAAAPACMMCMPTGTEADPMSCADGRDNDCNGRVDCADATCARLPNCVMCMPTGPESCADGRDNDCNGAADCADAACRATPACSVTNDTCASPTILSIPGRASGTTATARDDFTPTCVPGGSPDVVYVIRNPTTQTLVIDTEVSSYDTTLVVFRDSCMSMPIACDDDGGTGTNSRLVLTNAAPGTYFIVVDGWNGNSGAYQLNVRVGLNEVCDNRVDDDGDGLVDCADRVDCGANPVCAMCMPTGPENNPMACADGRDNDCDGAVDCADAGCAGIGACACVPTPEVCNDGRDNDCDMAVDCTDRDCIGSRLCPCLPTGAEADPMSCADGRDNDCDGFVDCADLDCRRSGVCGCVASPEVCNDRVDNDCDMTVDCADRDCAGTPFCPVCVPTAEVCNDGRDNDCDMLVDCADRDCAGNPLCPMCVPTGTEADAMACSDGRDNDCDGAIDCADSFCVAQPVCTPPPVNDTCARPTPVAVPSSTRGNLDGARNDFTPVMMGFPGCNGGAGGDVVYVMTVARATMLTIDTLGSDFDTVLYVRRAPCDSGTQLACNDDASGVSSRVNLAVTPGTYFIFVDGFGPTARGNFVLNISEAGAREICNNLVDDDGDGRVDCADTDCAMDAACRCVPVSESTDALCADGRDNDCDGQFDCADADCARGARVLPPDERRGRRANLRRRRRQRLRTGWSTAPTRGAPRSAPAAARRRPASSGWPRAPTASTTTATGSRTATTPTAVRAAPAAASAATASTTTPTGWSMSSRARARPRRSAAASAAAGSSRPTPAGTPRFASARRAATCSAATCSAATSSPARGATPRRASAFVESLSPPP